MAGVGVTPAPAGSTGMVAQPGSRPGSHSCDSWRRRLPGMPEVRKRNPLKETSEPVERGQQLKRP
jgi:hypothetical protein